MNNTTYWIMFIVISIVPIYASMRVQAAFGKYSRVRSMSGYTGEEVAKRIMSINGIYDVETKAIGGSMTDHYNPLTKEVCLSQTVYNQNTIAALSVAAHEVGHAIQDAKGYGFLRLRHQLYPITHFSAKWSVPMIVFGGLIFQVPTLAWIGIILFSFTTLFSLVTLPVEFNASKRAVAALESTGILSQQELKGAKEVLGAAAMTYVAATAASMMMLLRYIMIFGDRDN
ncbi:MAG: zinc metallopeptidase [Cellulosilyticaceae bacterium]